MLIQPCTASLELAAVDALGSALSLSLPLCGHTCQRAVAGACGLVWGPGLVLMLALRVMLLQGGEEVAAKLKEAQEELNSTHKQLSFCLLRAGKPSDGRLLQVSQRRGGCRECAGLGAGGAQGWVLGLRRGGCWDPVRLEPRAQAGAWDCRPGRGWALGFPGSGEHAAVFHLRQREWCPMPSRMGPWLPWGRWISAPCSPGPGHSEVHASNGMWTAGNRLSANAPQQVIKHCMPGGCWQQ